MNCLSNYTVANWGELNFTAPNIWLMADTMNDHWPSDQMMMGKTAGHLIAHQCNICSSRIFTIQMNISNYAKWTCWKMVIRIDFITLLFTSVTFCSAIKVILRERLLIAQSLWPINRPFERNTTIPWNTFSSSSLIDSMWCLLFNPSFNRCFRFPHRKLFEFQTLNLQGGESRWFNHCWWFISLKKAIYSTDNRNCWSTIASASAENLLFRHSQNDVIQMPRLRFSILCAPKWIPVMTIAYFTY